MVSKGATTIWERWQLGVTAAMNSHNHPMYCTISTWFFKHLTGIRPLEKGFDRILIAPQPVKRAYRRQRNNGNRARQGSFRLEEAGRQINNGRYHTLWRYSYCARAQEYGAVYSGENCVYGANGFNAEEGISGAQEKDGFIQLEISSGRYAFVAVKSNALF